jgi:mannose-6-phosphate isomerase-like protein (cupin superfamily)
MRPGDIMRALFIVVLTLQAAARVAAPATYKTAGELDAALRKAAEATPDMATSAVANTDQYRINVVRRTRPQGAIAHPDGTEVHHVVEGGGTLVTGGTIVRATGSTALARIEGGESRHVARGDVILIPAGTPHWYKDLDGSITYLEVRFNVPAR